MEIYPKTNLIITDAKVIGEVEDIISRSLERVSSSGERGFIEESNRVVELHLQGLGLSILPESLKRMEKLEKLNLTARYYDRSNPESKRVIPEKQIHSIDLTHLQGMKYLKRLDLSYNELTTIDLFPLRFCPNLERIWFQYNKMQTIDLDPLADLNQLRYLNFNGNKFNTINLTPLSSCRNLETLWLKENKLESLDLSPLKNFRNLHSLNISENNLTQIDCTPLIGLKKLEHFLFDNKVQLQAFPTEIVNYNTLVEEHFYEIQWFIDDSNPQEKEWYIQYKKLINNFYYWESWLDYKKRKSNDPNDSNFVEYLADKYYQIKDLTPTNLVRSNKEKWRQQIKTSVKDQFLTATDLFSLLKEYWGPENENRLAFDLIDRISFQVDHSRIRVLRYWLNHFRRTRVISITWLEITILEEEKRYELKLCFNGGFLRNGEEYLPPLKNDNCPKDFVGTVEITYESDQFKVKSVLDILQRGQGWLEEKHDPRIVGSILANMIPFLRISRL